MSLRRLMLALAIATFIAAITTFWFSRRIVKPHKTVTVLEYVATARQMSGGEILTEKDMQILKWPESVPLQGAYEHSSDLVGKALLYPLAAGQPILMQQVSISNANTGLAARIPNGMRALSLKSDQIVGVAGYLLPGTHVDVLVTLHNQVEPITSPVLQNVQILTAGQKMQPDPDGKASPVDVVTLLVNPEDAEKVVLASTQGTVHFVLRNGSDRQTAGPSESRMSDLSAAHESHTPSAPTKAIAKAVLSKPKNYSVEVIRGDKRSMETFQ